MRRRRGVPRGPGGPPPPAAELSPVRWCLVDWMLEARLLTKCYSGIAVVDRVSFVIQPGEILGYLGPNGAGKSTTVKMLTGLLEPTSGHIFFHGQDVNRDRKSF